jgi:hypothetical protein
MTDGVDTQSQNTDYAKSLTEVEKGDVTIYPVYLETFNDVQPAANRRVCWHFRFAADRLSARPDRNTLRESII